MESIPRPAVIITAVLDPWLPSLLRRAGFEVHTATSGLAAFELALAHPPALLTLDAVLDDMSGTELCRLLRSEPAHGQHLPILIRFDGLPTPELRVAALRVGATDFISRAAGEREVLLKVEGHLEARRTASTAVDDGLLDPSAGFWSTAGLARRAREVAALMTRVQGPLACVVVELGGRATVRDLGAAVARIARLSDVVGDLGANRLGILAPGTNASGAVRLALRVREALVQTVAMRSSSKDELHLTDLVAGFDVVANPRHHPVDPFDLLHHASAALRAGEPTPEEPWIRRYAYPLVERRASPVPGTYLSPRPPATGINT